MATKKMEPASYTARSPEVGGEADLLMRMQLSVVNRRAAATSLAGCAKLPSRKCVQADARDTSAHWWPMSPCLSPLEGPRPWSPDPARRRRARRAETLLERNQRPAGYQERREPHSALG